MWQVWFLPLLIVSLTVALSLPVGRYLAWIMDGKYRAPRWLAWFERRLDTGPQNWKQYAIALLCFNTVMFLFGFALLSLQQFLPLNQLNPDGSRDVTLSPSTVFNTAVSFLTNTNLQHYSGEVHLTHFSQVVVIIWNMFVSAAVGFCAVTAMIRGLRGDAHMGNYYVDMWRVIVYVFLPASLVCGVLLLATGVPMTFDHYAQVAGIEGPQTIARGPVAALVPIKHLGTNGGGFFGANSAHPFENPNAWSNLLTCINILIFPFSLVVMFGQLIGKPRQAAVIYGVMLFLFVGMIGWAISWDTFQPNPGLTAHAGETYPTITVPAVAGLPVDQKLGNLEGKELRFGTSAGATYSAVTTAVTCGSVNCMHDSLNPLAGLTPFTGMWLNCVFGGKGVGLVNMLVYLIIGVFLAGLMVGRTPEYLGKKVEAREMKLAMLALLIHPIMILGPTGVFAGPDWGSKMTNNPGAHGFSEILYEYSSASANNGSGFEGLQDTYGFNNAKANPSPPADYAPALDIGTALVMLLSRFIPIIAPLALAAGLAAKKPTPFTTGTLRTDTFTFAFVLLGTLLLVGALLFMPAAVLGPVAEHCGPLPFGG
jgi:K+-transporting ATPase ATPase A chain